MTLPIVMQDGDGDYIRKSIDVNVIDREEDLFLCRLKTLRESRKWLSFIIEIKWSLM